ncbi:helix-turn-helix domain-containing protein [Streptomyces sp. G5(2025)]|uniref:helix-turn-helix domain-containing protein n=1 Tax=Streptomyces sp. G5(2025) TaxID=3406628 RepID=UPI003C28710A
MAMRDHEERPERPSQADGTAHLFSALGKQIKVLREHAGMSRRELGKAAHCGEALPSAIERGVRTPQPDLLIRVDAVLGARRPLLSEEIIEKRAMDRLARQQIFERWPSPAFTHVLEEGVLQRPIGGQAVHRRQLEHLVRVGSKRNADLYVLPTNSEEHPNLDSAFNLVTPKGRQQVAYTEAQGHPRLVTDPEEVRLIADRYGSMRGLALNPRKSVALIEKMLGER